MSAQSEALVSALEEALSAQHRLTQAEREVERSMQALADAQVDLLLKAERCRKALVPARPHSLTKAELDQLRAS